MAVLGFNCRAWCAVGGRLGRVMWVMGAMMISISGDWVPGRRQRRCAGWPTMRKRGLQESHGALRYQRRRNMRRATPITGNLRVLSSWRLLLLRLGCSGGSSSSLLETPKVQVWGPSLFRLVIVGARDSKRQTMPAVLFSGCRRVAFTLDSCTSNLSGSTSVTAL